MWAAFAQIQNCCLSIRGMLLYDDAHEEVVRRYVRLNP